MCKKDKKLLQHIWFLQHIAAALLVAAASGNLAGSIIRLQRYYILSFILTEFIIFEKLPFAIDVLQICCKYSANMLPFAAYCCLDQRSSLPDQ